MESWEQTVLVEFSKDPRDHWTVDDAMKGTSIIGSTGSGKTTGSGRKIATKFLLQGWGGLVLCAKNDEVELWEEYCKTTGRENDLIVFSKNSTILNDKGEPEPMVFNPIQYELTRPGEGAGDTFNLTNIFMNLHKIGNRATSDSESRKDDRFWDNALKRIISRTIELITLAGEDLTFRNIVEVIYSSPRANSPVPTGKFSNFCQMVKFEDEHREVLEKDFFLKCLAKIFNKTMEAGMTDEGQYTYNTLDRYFTSSLPNTSEHTHNAIIESFMGVAEPFLSGILKMHFSGKTNIFPEDIYRKNKVIILNFPVKEYLDAGVMAQGVFKLLFQQAMERRDTKKYPTPVFFWADEAQYFVNPYDQIFLTTARSSRTATVFLSQSISNYYAVMGSGEDGKAKVNSMMGNLTTKIFHANSDTATNEYASQLIGQAKEIMRSTNDTVNAKEFTYQTSEGRSSQYTPQIRPMEFTIMRTGGHRNDYKIDAVIFVTGRLWSKGTNYLRPFFKQQFDVKN